MSSKPGNSSAAGSPTPATNPKVGEIWVAYVWGHSATKRRPAIITRIHAVTNGKATEHYYEFVFAQSDPDPNAADPLEQRVIATHPDGRMMGLEGDSHLRTGAVRLSPRSVFPKQIFQADGHTPARCPLGLLPKVVMIAEEQRLVWYEEQRRDQALAATRKGKKQPPAVPPKP